ncbi:1972_t:CDS:1, partial [Cetraspora pellucida]
KKRKDRDFTSWKEYKEYVNGYPIALYKLFYTKIKVQNFIDQQNINYIKDTLN